MNSKTRGVAVTYMGVLLPQSPPLHEQVAEWKKNNPGSTPEAANNPEQARDNKADESRQKGSRDG